MNEPWTWDPYAVLGVARDATPLQVARAHRRLAKRHHPDLHPDAADQRAMHRINEAWRVLSVPSLRADYDRRHPSAAASRSTSSASFGPSRRPSGHWTATREPIRRETVNARSYREWRASTWQATSGAWPSAHGYARPSTSFGERSGAAPARATPRAASPGEAVSRSSFRDSGWAAILVAGVLVGFLLIAAGLGSQYWTSTARETAPIQLRLIDD